MTNSHAVKVISNIGTGILITIPFKTEETTKKVEILVIYSDSGVDTYGIEMDVESGQIKGWLYYIDADGNINYRVLSGGFWDCLQEHLPWWKLLICGSTCGACFETGNIWACLACAGCLGEGACYVGLCSLEEPWGYGFCASMYVQCYVYNNLVACAVYAGCDGSCP